MIGRLKIILDYYNLSASSFADMIDVPRSSISHLLSGRNKPSLDFIIKVEKAFDEIELDWLVYGKGNFPKKTFLENQNLKESKIITKEVKKEVPSLFTEKAVIEQEPKKKSNARFSAIEKKGTPVDKDIKSIVVLYTDGTFDDYKK